jgi:hypothetical protein
LAFLSRHELWYGRDEPAVESRSLSAGPVSVELTGADLHYIRAVGIELIRRLYVAVRDHNWKTVAAEVLEFDLQKGHDSFALRYEAFCRTDEIDLCWSCEIEGHRDGTITAEIVAVPERNFRYNRIGFCILLAPNSAGMPYRAKTPEGQIKGELPLLVAARETLDGKPCPLFPSHNELEVDLEREITVRLVYEGDLFEMEDQRNWTDASFKTYSTPLSLGFPHRARKGEAIRQRVTASFLVPKLAATAGDPYPRPPRLTLGDPLPVSLPRIGLGAASHGKALTEREVALLRNVQPDHLRIDVDLGEPVRTEIERLAREAAALHTAVELAVCPTDDAEGGVAELASALSLSGATICRVLVLNQDEPSTASRWVQLARDRLGPLLGEVPYAGGTNAYFCHVNQHRPDPGVVDAIVYSITPQVHAFDETSIVESAQMQAETVRTALSFSAGKPIVISPVTMLPRFNPSATESEPEPPPGTLPPEVDPRQMSLFAAAWTVASAKYLAESGVHAVTYYETTGWRGILEIEDGPPLPERFRSRPGMVFPIYHVLADLGERKRASLRSLVSTAPLSVDGLALDDGRSLRLLVACLVPQPQTLILEQLPDGIVSLRRLNESTAQVALLDPELFRFRQAEEHKISGGQIELELAPFEIVRMDVGHA